jgi:3-isopropylmalate/(R)-2-methylmalate dehydratase small subunit
LQERERYTEFVSGAVAIPIDNIDTDQIIPARFLRITHREGLSDALFAEWRKDPEFPLNQPTAPGAKILVAGDNFGCGSSREHAAWALMAWGFKAVVSSSFADIFKANALKNGLLPIAIEPASLDKVMRHLADDPACELEVDLAQQVLVLPTGMTVRYPVDQFAKKCLLEGIDELDYVLAHDAEITAFERLRGDVRPGVSAQADGGAV